MQNQEVAEKTVTASAPTSVTKRYENEVATETQLTHWSQVSEGLTTFLKTKSPREKRVQEPLCYSCKSSAGLKVLQNKMFK